MSQITTRSAFYFGHVVTSQNRSIDFSEGGGELQATLVVGSYTLNEFAIAIKNALDGAGALTYSVNVDRTTRQLTISSTSNFELLCNSGSRAATSAWSLMGFDTASDRTGASSYQGENASGLEYITQAPVDQYVSADDWQLKENADVSVTATGKKQTAFFGDGKRIQMNIRLITNKTISNRACDPNHVYNNATGIEDARTLMNALIDQGRVEFIPDIADRDTFEKCVLEKTNKSNTATGYMLENMEMAGYLETGKLLFRVVQ